MIELNFDRYDHCLRSRNISIVHVCTCGCVYTHTHLWLPFKLPDSVDAVHQVKEHRRLLGRCLQAHSTVSYMPMVPDKRCCTSLYDSHWNKPAYMQKALLDNSTCTVDWYTTLGLTRKERSITCCSSQWKIKKFSSRSTLITSWLAYKHCFDG